MFDSMDSQSVTLLVLLDLSAAFDTVSHSVLFSALEGQFGISGTVLKWFKSYLDGRRQKVLVENVCSEPNNLASGVPQGSCLWPVLLVMYITSLYDLISRHLPLVNGYADENQFTYHLDQTLNLQLTVLLPWRTVLVILDAGCSLMVL